MSNGTITIYTKAQSLAPDLPLTPLMWETAKQQIAKDLNDQEFLYFVGFANSQKMNPLARDIYAMKIAGKLTFVTSIDGYRKRAQATGRYDGRTAPMWLDSKGAWQEAWLSQKEKPLAARVGVRIRGVEEPTFAVVTWAEFGRTGNNWDKMPAHMLAKIAEAHALRAAFPDALGGLCAAEEVEAPSPSPSKVVRTKRAADIIDVPAEPVFDVGAWWSSIEHRCESEGWTEDQFVAVSGKMIAIKGFGSRDQVDAEFRKKFEESLGNGKLAKFRDDLTPKSPREAGPVTQKDIDELFRD